MGMSGRYLLTIFSIFGVGVDGRITSPRKNDPMDSVHVGKAVFVQSIGTIIGRRRKTNWEKAGACWEN